MANEVEIVVTTKDKTDFGGIGNRLKSAASTVGSGISGILTSHVGKALMALPAIPQVAIAGAAVGAALAAPVGAALSAGLLLAVGGGVLAAGIAAAAKHPAVKGAWKEFTEVAGNVFKDFGKPFVGPVKRALEEFSLALSGDIIAPGLMRIGEAMAPVIDKLAPALALMAENAMPGIEAAVTASVPLFEALAAALPGIGESISGFFQSMADGAPGALIFFQGLLAAIGPIVEGLGATVGWLSQLFAAIVQNESVGSYFSRIGEVISGTVLPALRSFWEWIQEKLVPVLRDVGERYMAALVEGFQSLRETIAENEPQLRQLWRAFQRVAEFIVEKVIPVIGTFLIARLRFLFATIRTVINIVGWLVDAFNEWPPKIGNAVNRVVAFLRGLPGRASAAIRALPGAVSRVLSSAASTMARLASSGVSSAVRFLAGLPGRAAAAIRGLPGAVGRVVAGAGSWLYSAGRDIVAGLARGVRDAMGGAISQARNAARSIADGFKRGLGISSPSKVMADEVGRWIPAGIAQGIIANMGVVSGAIGRVAHPLARQARSMLQALNKGTFIQEDFSFSGMGSNFRHGALADAFYNTHKGFNFSGSKKDQDFMRKWLQQIAAPGTAAGGSGGSMQINLILDGKVMARVLLDPMRQTISSKGGNVQAVLGVPGR